MLRTLPGARIEILDVSRQPAPEGDYQFPLTGLHSSPAGGYWNGFVAYGHQRRLMIWARVHVAVSSDTAVAVEELKPGRVIEPGQLRLESRDESFSSSVAVYVTDLSAAAGRVPRRTIAAGEPIRPEWLEAPKEVQRGDTVRVEAVRGAACLKFEGIAQASGANPTSKRRFPARVEGKGKVVVKSVP